MRILGYRKEGSEFTGKDMYRSAADWYKIFKPAFAEGNMNETQLKAYIEQTVRQYCNLYWDDTDAETWIKDAIDAELDRRNITTYLSATASNKKMISDEFFAELMNGKLVSVFDALRNYQITQAHKRAAAKVNQMAKMMNQPVRFMITDSSVKEGEPSKFAGCKIGFAAVPGDVTDPEEWVTNINEEGNAQLGWFTAYALVRNSVPFRLTLFDENDEPEKTFDFTLDGVSKSTVINIDLAKDGVKVDTKHLDDLKLVYTPESVVISPKVIYIIDFPIPGFEKHEEEFILNEIVDMDDKQNNYDSYFGKARWCTELERFFNQHDFITVDPISGNFTIGDDISGKLEGNSASGTFTINTDYKYLINTPKQWINNWNTWINNGEYDDVIGVYNFLLNGSVKHQIACKYTLKRRRVEDHFEYDITYTGEGLWDHTMKYVDRINKPVGVNEFDFENLPYLELYDISIGTDSQGGDVTLEYTTTLK